ncbi:outer membrane beta-barrel protein [Hydrogenophaga aquatica]
MTLKPTLALGLATLAVATYLPINAQAESNWYLLGATGVTNTSGRTAQSDAAVSTLGAVAFTSQGDEADRGHKLQLGYRFSPSLVVEGGYMDLGRFTYSADMPTVATRAGNLKMNAWNLNMIGTYPLGSQLSLFGKLGIAAHRTKFHCEGTGIACVNPSRKASGTSLHYGVGVEWAFSPNWFARAEYEVVRKVGDAFNAGGTTGTSQADVKLGSIGIGYRF